MKEYWSYSTDELLKELNGSRDGLTDSQVEEIRNPLSYWLHLKTNWTNTL